MKTVHNILAFIAALVITVCLRGFVVACMWGWFLSNPFGAPRLSIPLAAGLAGLIGYLTNRGELPEPGKKFDANEIGLIAIKATVASICTLSVAWVLHFLI